MAMRGPVIALVVTALLAGCTTRQKIAGGGAGVALVGVVLTFSTESQSEEDAEDTAGTVGIVCLLTGLAVLFVAAALDESSQKSKATEIKVSTAKSETQAIDQKAAAAVKQKREQAIALTKQAEEAARTGDCAKVTELSAQVGALDAKFYSEVFLTDEAVQNCFVPKEQPPAETPPPVPPVVPSPPPVPPVTPVTR